MRSSWGSIERRGNSYDIRYRDPITGRPRRKKIGDVDELGEHISDDVRDELIADFRRANFSEDGQTFRDFLDSYEHVYRMKVRPSTYDTTYPQMRLLCDLLPMPMERVTVAVAEAVMAKIARRGLRKKAKRCKPSTVRLHVRRLTGFWNAAIKRGVVTENPWAAVDQPGAQAPIVVAVDTFGLDHVVRHSPRDLQPLIRVLGETGLRISEAAALRWRDVEGDRLTVRKSKTGKGRVVPLTPMARDAFDAMPVPMNRSRLVFPGIDTRGKQSYRLKRFQKALGIAGMEPMTFHHLRHSLGYRLARAGCNALQVSKILGNTEEVCKRYMDHNPQEMAALAIEQLQRHETASRQRKKAQ